MNYGLVEDINDPQQLGRVKVRVYGVHTKKILTKDLPWSISIMPPTTPAVRGIGHSVNLLVGTLVVGMFSDNSNQDFLILGTLPTKTSGVQDNNVRVRGGIDPNATDTMGAMQPPSGYAPTYPYNNVYETESGHVKEYDDTPGSERINERHKSGTSYEIQPNGSKVEKIVRDNYTLVMHDDTLEVHGSVNIIVSENCNLAVAGYLTANVGGDMDVAVAGNTIITSENDITLNAKNSKIKLDTPTVECTGNITVVGDVIADSDITLETHVHPGDGGDNSTGNTGEPV